MEVRITPMRPTQTVDDLDVGTIAEVTTGGWMPNMTVLVVTDSDDRKRVINLEIHKMPAQTDMTRYQVVRVLGTLEVS